MFPSGLTIQLWGAGNDVHRPPEGTAPGPLLLSLREAVRVLPSLVEHGVVVPPLHPRAHHDKSRPVDEVDGRDVLVSELLEPEVKQLSLFWIGQNMLLFCNSVSMVIIRLYVFL